MDGGTTGLFGVQFLLAALLMLPATLCLGALLPVVISVAGRVGARLVVSSLYAANLLGSATGALVASGLLLASVGLSVLVQVGVLVALGVAIVATVRLPGSHARTIAATVAAVILVLALDGGARQLALSFGLYHGAPGYVGNDDRGIRDLLASHELLFYRDGPTATARPRRSPSSGSTATSC